ncbi:SpaA isopeptide-forming pilin-related protein [Ruminococcus sp.]|uniref:SpaA isopeptide-forming pilin-related protein n=1 Tax=Ruminococcus sp. TaxID=41978 RepID=UPI0025EB31F3|nr:SpaA isopeptide-forming pilin-related protein [Ruminococcus sp.]
MSIELYPDEQNEEKTVMLDGLMPEGAEAQAVDVSEEHDGIAAYDITITAGENEYQPGEENPILVEISDPAIHDSDCLQLWHIRDDGEREQINDFSVEEGKISFYATGFSIYEIVDDVNVRPFNESAFFDVLDERGEEGFYVSFLFGGKDKPGVDPGVADNGQFYLKNDSMTISNQGDRKGISLVRPKNTSDGAVKLYFQSVEGETGRYYLYIKDGSVRKYIKMYTGTNFGNGGTNNGSRSALDYTTDENEKTKFVFDHASSTDNQYKIYATLSDNKKHYWVADDKYNPKSIVGYQSAGDANSAWITIYDFSTIPDDPYKLNGKTYGLMHYVSGATGNALMATDNALNSLKVNTTIVRPEGTDTSKLLYVAQNTDITEWTFEWAGDYTYYIYAQYGETKKYLNLGKVNATDDENTISAIETDSPQKIKVTPDNQGRILLSVGDKRVDFLANNENINESGRFVTSANGSYLYFVSHTALADDEMVTYKAKEVSVSEVKNGEQVVIYTRIWDDNKKRYNFYAIDHDGSLVPCYERGDSIMWLSNKVNTMIWDFTEYYYEYTEDPNYYYELYNPYSEKYIAPRRSSNSVLSDDPIGINLEGRRYGEYFSQILAWDLHSYSYSGVKADLKTDSIEVTSRAKADTFYFARVVDLKNDLTEVETIDNTDYGITMKMVKYRIPDGNKYIPDNATTSKEQHRILGNSHYSSSEQHSGLLSTNLTDGKFPTATETQESLSELYTNSSNLQSSNVVNHLFIKSIYEQSGYFEFDSCQNFATLKNYHQSENEDGEKLYLVIENGEEVVKSYADGVTVPAGAEPIYDFFVSKELGTHEGKTSDSLKHGQFFPYDDIDMDTYANENKNGLNLFKAILEPLEETDPRKYERLHLINDADYYFGMELDAGFTQTPDGKDNWGHDIIFEFTGDDDFWLYVDGELVIDLGGIHSALPGKVNFATGDVEVNGKKTNLRDQFVSNYRTRGKSDAEIIEELKNHFAYDTSITNPQISDFEKVFKDYTNHSMKIFYMERGAGASNLHMRFNLNYVKEGNVTMTKEVTGSDDVDFDFVEYPVQIWYCSNKPGTDEPDETSAQLLDPTNEHVKVNYQNSTRTVVFKNSYTPPGANRTYEKVFFINAEQKLEIHFPDNATHYKIVECGINKQVYDQVYINGAPAEDLGTDGDGVRYSYSSGWAMVKKRTNLMLSNHVDPKGLRSLVFQKKLYDADYDSNMSGAEKKLHKITAEQDPTTFSFRLYLSNGVTNEINLTNMFNYRVIDPEQYYCQWNMAKEKLERYVPDPDAEYLNEAFELLDELKNDNTLTTAEYAKLRNYFDIPLNTSILTEALADIKNIRRDQTDTNGNALPSPLTSEQRAVIREALLYPITFETSINGQISDIPAWYTVEVPNLPAGTVFKVEEKDSAAERPLGYDRVEYERDQDSYHTLEDGVENVGVVSSAESPYMNVINKRGYEIQAKKVWTDRDAASGHDDICVALYIKQSDGTYKIADNIAKPVRCLKSPDTEVRFFMESLDGHSLSDFYIFEVTPKVAYTVDDNGYVSGYTDANNDFDRIIDGTFANINAIDRVTHSQQEYKYAVTYASGESVNPLNSIQAKKTWSAGETAIYTALCVKQADNTYKLADSSLIPVRKLIAPNDTVRYFISELDEGKVADDYKIFEIAFTDLTDQNITVNDSGHVSGYSDSEVESIVNGNQAADMTSTFEVYTARSDSITNTRQGGIVIGLYKMGTRQMANHTINVGDNETAGVPLAGGAFKLEKVETTIDPKTNKRKRSLIGNYTSDADGKITIMYSFETNSSTGGNFEDDVYYELTQISSPTTYIGLPEPVKFAVGLGDDPDIIVSGNEAKWNNYHKLPGSTEEVVAFIDVYNKPFTLKAIKVDSEDNTVLDSVHFALYKGVISVDGLIPADQPINGYSDLVTDSNGEIPRIIQSLEKGTYFLKETSPKFGYKPYDRYIRFVIGENDIELVASVITQTTMENNVTVTTITSNTGLKLVKTDSDSYSCVLQIPNEKDNQNFFFDIEKIIFVDKNIHVSDEEQKFVFKVDRFDENETAFVKQNIRGTFYVTISCDKKMIYTTDDDITLDGVKYNYSFYHYDDTVSAANSKFRTSDSSVEKRYTVGGKAENGSADYVYPAAIWNGRKTVRVMKEGIYRISEVNKWSSTDYDFWKGSNCYKGYGDGTHGETAITNGFRDSNTSGSMALPATDKDCVYINVKNVRAGEFDTASKTLDSKTVWRPTASFTNSETEYAYLSSQAYADNTISR